VINTQAAATPKIKGKSRRQISHGALSPTDFDARSSQETGIGVFPAVDATVAALAKLFSLFFQPLASAKLHI
jgi:hypothetical protein